MKKYIYTKSGFPKNVDSAEELLVLLRERHADRTYITLHDNFEPDCNQLHKFMWELIKGGLIVQQQRDLNDYLFRVKITFEGMSYLRSLESIKQGELNIKLNIIAITISILGILMSLLLAIL